MKPTISQTAAINDGRRFDGTIHRLAVFQAGPVRIAEQEVLDQVPLELHLYKRDQPAGLNDPSKDMAGACTNAERSSFVALYRTPNTAESPKSAAKRPGG
ncbi:MAG TPA: hypothetical protein VFS22_06080 [Flavisolibacter sp.]|nr:hypothetical protein [Flavisolibacter sp.]